MKSFGLSVMGASIAVIGATAGLNLDQFRVGISLNDAIWLVSFGVSMGVLITVIKQTVAANIRQNNDNHRKLMFAFEDNTDRLELLTCFIREQIRGATDPEYPAIRRIEECEKIWRQKIETKLRERRSLG